MKRDEDRRETEGPPPAKPRLAIWFRYGAAEHAELFHALPDILAELARHFDLFYISLTSREKPDVPENVLRHARVRQLPITISRHCHRDKKIKTLLWIALTPVLSAWCRMQGIRYVYVEETMPLVLPIGRLFFGSRMTITVADLFVDQYIGRHRLGRYMSALLFKFDCRAWRKAAMIFTRSASARTYLNALGIPKERIHYAYDAVDHTVYHPRNRSECRRIWHYADEDRVMVYHGVLHPNKALDLVLRALPPVLQDIPQLRFLIIGNGPEEARLKKITERAGLGEVVRFAGFVPPDGVATALGAADIGLVTRRGDLGDQLVVTSVLGHCLACGTAVLATRTSGIAELIKDGENGLLFEAQNEQDFTRKLLRLCRDEDVRKRLAEHGLQTAGERLSTEETVKNNTRPIIETWGRTETA